MYARTMNRLNGNWENAASGSIQFTCGFCGSFVASSTGWATSSMRGNHDDGQIRLCTHCNRPVYFEIDAINRKRQHPSVAFGEHVANLPEGVDELYQEARACTGASAFTAAVMVCRTILSHVAEEKGVAAGSPFNACIDYLVANNWVPKNAAAWADKIRKLGNAATHKLAVMDESQAREIVKFTQWLLKFVYEFEADAPKPTS